MRQLLASLTIAAFGLGTIACGATSEHRSVTGAKTRHTAIFSRAPASPYLSDGDWDPTTDEDGDEGHGNKTDTDNDYQDDHRPHDSASYHDYDDDTGSFGNPAGAAESRTVTTLVERYRKAAARHDGARACELMYPPLVEELPEDYERSGPSYLRGLKSCRAILSALFEHTPRRHLAGKFAVTEVRVKGNQAVALLGSRTLPASYLRARREAGVWTVDSLLDTPLG